MELDPRLQDVRENSDRPIESPYAYPPASAAASGPAPYVLNQAQHQSSISQQQRNGAARNLSSSVLQSGLPYYGVQQDQQHQTTIPPANPSLSNSTGQPPTNAPGDPDTPKRPRACEACRGLKVRCDFEQEAEVCKRCAKANRECIVTAPSRRRPKKTDTRVAELEKRIDDLTATLADQQRQSGAGKRLSSDENFDSGPYHNGHPGDFHAEPARKKRKPSHEDPSSHISNGAITGHHGPGQHTSNYSTLPPMPPDHLVFNNEYADVIDRGILSNAAAVQIYDHYTNDMAKHLPAVVFPSTMTAGGLRKSKPVLFLAILSVASGQDHPELQRTLTREASKALADRILCKGEKTLELVQAMQVLSIWHASEDQNDTMAFQLIQMASTMAIAMELGGTPLKGHLGVSFISGSTKTPSDFNSPEKRRTWLSCYTLSGSTSLPLKQMNLIPRSHFLENTLSFLETSPEATATDKILCKWARLQHIMDQASELAHLASSPPSSPKPLNLRGRIRDALGDAQAFARSVPADVSYSLKLAAHEMNIYCHLIATKIEEMFDGGIASQETTQTNRKTQPKNQVPTKIYQESIKACATSIHELLDLFLTHPESASQIDLNSLPSFHFARIAYALLALLCMYFAASAPDSLFRPAVEPNDLRVAYYLPRLLELLRSTATDETKRPVQKFQLIVKMLKTWYERTKEGRKSPIRNELTDLMDLKAQPVDDERNTPRLGYRKLSVHGRKAEDDNCRSPSTSKASHVTPSHLENANIQPGNTPLELLSHVATNAQTPQTHNHSWYENTTSYQPYPQSYSSGVSHGADNQTMSAGSGYSGLVIDPALEQAMGMAFGSEGNMFPTFVDDFFGGMTQGLQYGWFQGSGGE